MKIIEQYNDFEIEIIEIISAKYIGDYAVRIFFNDGSNKLVDFKHFLETSLHPSIHKYLNEEKFKQFEIIDGNLNWNNYDMIFPVYDLYNDKI
jgi:hypothetical protein